MDGSTVGTISVVSMIGRPPKRLQVIDDAGRVPDRSARTQAEAQVGAQIQRLRRQIERSRLPPRARAATSDSASAAIAASSAVF